MRKVLLSLSVVSVLAGCGSDTASNNLPNAGALAREIPPAVATSRAAHIGSAAMQQFDSLLRLSQPVGRAITYNTDGWSTYLGQIQSVFGTNMTGVNTQIAVQLAQLETLMTDIASNNYTDTDGFVNCTETITSATAAAPSSAFPGDAVFWASSVTDTGKYTCLIKSQSTSGGKTYNYLTMLGREALTTPATNCQAVNNHNYYIVNAYSTGTSTDGGYQIQRLVMNGCTRDMKLAMSLATIYPSQDNFTARFEMTGNPDTHAFQVRTINLNGDSPTYNGWMIEAAGVSRTINSTANYFPAKYRACSGSNCGTAGATKTMCMKTGTTDGSYTQEAVTSSTNCDAHETSFNEVSNSTNGFEDAADVNQTWIDFSLNSSFGL